MSHEQSRKLHRSVFQEISSSFQRVPWTVDFHFWWWEGSSCQGTAGTTGSRTNTSVTGRLRFSPHLWSGVQPKLVLNAPTMNSSLKEPTMRTIFYDVCVVFQIPYRPSNSKLGDLHKRFITSPLLCPKLGTEPGVAIASTRFVHACR